MEELDFLLKELVGEELCRMILSNPVDREKGSKVTVRPVMMKGELSFQETLYKGNKVYHRNCTAEELRNRILSYMQTDFKQAEIETTTCKATVLVSKKGKLTIKKKYLAAMKNGGGADTLQKDRQALLSHNRTKKYILEEGKPVDFLVGLGVQTPDGRIVKAKYDKFRQINRYLEFIEDIVKKLPNDRPVRIIDFGCGKSYLTFAMYYYLHVLKQYEVRVTGLDLKEDVIDFCNELAEKYHYEHLHFEKGDISTYEGADAVDMVVTLHACDTATDYALEKAVKWGARVIMAVPCCQHEVNRQISSPELSQILKYGLIKERMSALITDAVRANLLEEMGYDTQILEFIDMEHTPKNLLIRAVKREGMRPKGGDIRQTTEFLHIETTLQRLLEEQKD
ncbi:MAG: class I SAM-dependent methyltransferase [Lachnospiraceae bacterium]